MSEIRHSLDIIPDIGSTRNGFELQHREEVFLPEQTEQRIEQNTLPKLLKMVTEAGVSDTELDRLTACYKALGRRPSQLGVSYDFHFSNDGKYFGPVVGLDSSYRAMPDVLSGTDFKLRTGDKEPQLAPVNKEEVYNKFSEARIMTGSEEEREYRGKVNAYERTLTKINRIMYRVHDALHIYQNILIGDQLNALKSKSGLAGFTNEDIERKLIKRGNYAKIIRWSPPKWAKNSIFTTPDIPDHSEIPDYNPQVINNEATMDVMSEWLLKEELAKEPELMLWLHNTMSHAVEGLEEIRKQYRLIRNLDDADILPYKQMEHIINMISAAYFAVYENSEQAKTDLLRKEYSVADQPAQATIADSAYFDRCTVLNLLSEIEQFSRVILQYHRAPKHFDNRSLVSQQYQDLVDNSITFPSGQEWGVVNSAMGPITSKGIETAAAIAGKVVENNGNLDDLLSLFLQEQSKMDTSLKMDQPAERQYPMIKKIKDLYGLKLSNDDIVEMRNIFHYLDMSGRLTKDYYPYQYVVRKKLIEEIRNKQPEQVNQLIKWTVFEFPMYFRKEDYYDLTGFGVVKKEPTSMDVSEVKILPWDQVLSSQKLGFFNLNMTTLNPEQISEVKEIYNHQYRKKDHAEDLQALANIARMQKQIV